MTIQSNPPILYYDFDRDFQITGIGINQGQTLYLNIFNKIYFLCTQGAPHAVRLFRYASFDGPGAILANKSFYKADRVDMLWNRKGKFFQTETLYTLELYS